MKYTSIAITGSVHRKTNHVYIHPYYDPTKFEYNIAVIEVDLPIPFVYSINAAVLPKSPPIPYNGKLNITVPNYTDTMSQSLKPYMASLLLAKDCAEISGNMDFPASTLMWINKMFLRHDLHVSSEKVFAYFIKLFFCCENSWLRLC